MACHSLVLLIGGLLGFAIPFPVETSGSSPGLSRLDNCSIECNHTRCCCHASLRKACDGTNVTNNEVIDFVTQNISWTGCEPPTPPNIHTNEQWPGTPQIHILINKEDDGCCAKPSPYNCEVETCEIKFQFKFTGAQPGAGSDCAPPCTGAETTAGPVALDSSTNLFALITRTPSCGNCPDFQFYLVDGTGQALTDTKTIFTDCDPCPIGPG